MLVTLVNPICSLCLELKAHKTIWKGCTWNGNTEVYGDMLKECLNVSWPRDRSTDTICEVCISRLRNSVLFKRKVLEALAKLDHLEDVPSDVKIRDESMLNDDDPKQDDFSIKCEIVPIKTEREINIEISEPKMEPMIDFEKYAYAKNYIQLDASLITQHNVMPMKNEVEIDEGNDMISEKTEYGDAKQPDQIEVIDSMEVDKIPYHKLPKVCKVRKKIKFTEYVVIDSVRVPCRDNPAFASVANPVETSCVSNTATSIRKNNPDKSSSISNSAKSSNISNSAKLNNISNSAKAGRILNSAKSRCVSNSAKSSSIINIAKLRNTSNTAHSKARIRKGRDMAGKTQPVYVRLRLNTCLLLEHSTLLPFTFNKGYLECFFCKVRHVNFDELKTHTRENHTVNFETLSRGIMRPNSKVRVDATLIACKICGDTFEKINGLTQHLVVNHKIDFNDTAKPEASVLPYILGDGKFICYQCKREFDFFKTLSHHMNEHSTDNMCATCGQCFLLPQRLKVHIALHHDDPKTVKCEICGKVFPHSIALRGHVRYTHKKISNLCLLCNIKFDNNELRLQHFELAHKGVAVNRTCKICSKRFTSVSGLNSHIRNSHPSKLCEAKHACRDCDMKFSSNYKLKEHSLVHTQEKNYECDVCQKRFGRAYTLKEHLKIHFNDKRWSCRVCSQSFVQKCSLKSHIRVHHGDCDPDDAMVYIKT